MKENGNQVINTNIQLEDIKYNYSIDLTNENQSAALILNKIRNNTRILEFGPAIGNMTRYMKLNLGCQVDCVEIDPNAASIVKEFANKIIVDDLDNGNWYTELVDERYDYIIFADVLEHLRYPKKALNLAKKLLNDDGEILISVPNISHNAILLELMNDKFFYQKEGLLDETHIHFFTEKSLKHMIDECNLVVAEQFSTKLKPQETEFQASFDEIPSEITQYLKSRKNANTYQFIYLLKSKKNNVLPQPNAELLIENDIDYIQIYANQNEQFTEKYSSRINLLVSNELIRYKMNIPESFYGKLRLDIGNAPSYFFINSLILENIYTNERKEHDLELLQENENIIKLDNNSFLSIGEDPYFYTEFNLEKKQKYVLYLEILYLPSYTNIYKNYLKNNILSSKSLIKEQQNAYENIVKQNRELNHCYEEINKQNSQLYNEKNFYKKEYYKMMNINQEKIKQIKKYEALEISLEKNILELEKELESIKQSYLFRMKEYLDKLKKR